MKKICFIVLTTLCLHPFNVKCQLMGNAFLQGQTNHSGITAKFISQGGTAVTDSATTTSTGSYSINITGGVYKVVFSKLGYLSSNYNNGNTIVLTNTTVLNNYTLAPGAQVFVSGNVSGNWTNNNVYIVNGNITIPLGSTLNIQPGTTIKFNGNYSIIDNGVLLALGTSTNPILFTSNVVPQATSDWSGIQAHNSSSIIDHCIIEYCNIGIDATGYSPTISNSILRNMSQTGIYCNNCAPHIFNNEVYNIISSSGAAIGVWVESYLSAVIECNHIHDCKAPYYHGYGLITNSNTVKNNTIHDITGVISIGIDSRYSGSIIENNYIYNCGWGLAISNTTATPYPLITNNTIDHNTIGINMDNNWWGPVYNPSIINNILTNNQYGISQTGSSSLGNNVSYNLVWNNSSANYSNVQITGIGQIVGNNSHGNPIDSYYNMSQDPLFSGGIPPILNSASPCLNSGNAAYSSNVGYEILNTCQTVVANSIFYASNLESQINIYPNPTSGKFIIETTITDKQLVELYDVSGRLLLSKTFVGMANIDANDFDNGVYTLTIKNNFGTTTKKLIIAR